MKQKIDIIEFEGCVVETDTSCFEITKDSKYNSVSVQFTNKTANKKDFWDNETWLKGVYEKNPESIRLLKEAVKSKEDRKVFRKLLKHIIEKRGWLK